MKILRYLRCNAPAVFSLRAGINAGLALRLIINQSSSTDLSALALDSRSEVSFPLFLDLCLRFCRRCWFAMLLDLQVSQSVVLGLRSLDGKSCDSELTSDALVDLLNFSISMLGSGIFGFLFAFFGSCPFALFLPLICSGRLSSYGFESQKGLFFFSSWNCSSLLIDLLNLVL